MNEKWYTSKTTIICLGTVFLFLLSLLGNIIYHQNFKTDLNALQMQTEKDLNTSYDIYKDNEKIASVYDYDNLRNYIVEKYQNKIAAGDGKIFFDDSVSVVEKYDNTTNQQDDVETYEKIIDEAQFVASAVQVVELDSGKSYYVPNLQIWENSLTKIQNAITNNDAATSLQLESATEYTVEDTNLENILTEEEVIQQIMNEQNLEYTIAENDTLQSIATNAGISVQELLLLNPQYTENAILVPGATMKMTTSDYHDKFTKISVVTRTEQILYDIEYIDDENLYSGQEEIIIPGIDGEAVIQMSVKYTDEGEEVMLNRDVLLVSQEPVTQVVKRGTKESPSVGTGKFIFPTASHRTSTEFGDDYLYGQYRFHSGLDINEGLNANIMAADNGIVITNEYSSSYGNYIVIDHNNGYYTLYAHLNKSNVRVGQVVRQGELIGFMGSTGLSTGYHLHFEIREGGNTKNNARNPRDYIGY